MAPPIPLPPSRRALLLAALPLGAVVARAAEPAPDVQKLLDALPAAPDQATAAALEARIRTLWRAQASPAVELLLQRGEADLEADADDAALETLDAALTLQPDLPAGLMLRAQALAALGDNAAAAADLRRTLVLEPRHFGALVALSALQEQQGDLEGAWHSMQEAVSLHPWMEGGGERLKNLARRVRGQPT